MMPEGNKPSRDLEREIETTRARVDSTLESIQRKLTPGQLMDEAILYLQGEGDRHQRFRNAVSGNPLPLLFLGVGAAWLAWSVLRDSEPEPHLQDADGFHGLARTADRNPEAPPYPAKAAVAGPSDPKPAGGPAAVASGEPVSSDLGMNHMNKAIGASGATPPPRPSK